MTATDKLYEYRYPLVAALILAVFWNTLANGFVWDDLNIIVYNPLVGSLRNIPKFFFLEDIADGPTGYYRPVTYISFALDRALWGLNPLGFNITNVGLHITCALLFYRLVAELFKSDRLGLYSTLIFSLHPIVVETVNFHAGGRNTLLSACLSLAAFLFYIRRREVPAAACFAAAIFSKEFALLMPAIFFLYDRTMGKEDARWTRYVPYVILIACYLVLRSAAVSQGNLLRTMNITDNFWIVPQTLISYLRVMLVPTGIKVLYDVNNQITWASFGLYTACLLALVAVAILFRARREVLFSVALFVLFLLPVSNIFPLGTAMMADRYAYFALMGFSLAAGYLVCLAKRKVGVAAIVFLCIFFISIDIPQNAVWKNEISLFTQMVKDAPEVTVGYINLGYAFYDRFDHGNAQKNFIASRTKKDLNARMLLNTGTALWELNNTAEALASIDKAIDLEPGNYQAWVLGNAFAQEYGDKERAAKYRERVAGMPPRVVETMRQQSQTALGRGEELLRSGNPVKAERYYYDALRNDPHLVPALQRIGALSAQRGDMKKAAHYFRHATRLDPMNAETRYNLARVYKSLGMEHEAEQEMNNFRNLSPSSRR